MYELSRRGFLLGAAGPAAQTRPPNVLLILCDQLNPAVLGVYGGPVETPHIQRIAEAGVVFRGATCTSPFCSPSRASILTGQYPHKHGIVYNVMQKDYPAAGAAASEGIRRTDVTTEGILAAAGYATHHYGKWHLSGDDLPYLPDQYGEHREYAREMAATFRQVRQRPRAEWMDWYGWALPVEVDPAFRRTFVEEPLPERRYTEFISKAGRLQLPVAQNFDVRVADKTVERLRAVGEKPFMTTCSFNLPHDPNVVPSPYYEMYNPEKIELPANYGQPEGRFRNDWSRLLVGGGERRLRELLRLYYASVRLIDDQVGRVLDALEETGRAEDTVVIFTADHGDMAGGHGMFWKSTSSFYDEVATIPFIVSYPRQVKPGRSDAPASLVDICPTVLEFTGQTIPAAVQGRSLGSVLTADGGAGRAYNFCERVQANKQRTRDVAPGALGQFMVRGQGWKYARYSDGEEFLYNLRKDPGETRNLAGERSMKATKEELSQEIKRWLEETGYVS